MKKKGPRSIPDFSRQKPQGKQPLASSSGETGRKATPAPSRQTVKPTATSSKSGRRGQ